MSPIAVRNVIQAFGLQRVSLTGGNPVEQSDLFDLIDLIREWSPDVDINLEHPGVFLDFGSEIEVMSRCNSLTIDVKPPSSKVKVSTKNIRTALRMFTSRNHIEIKAVFSNTADLDWFEANLDGILSYEDTIITFQPAWNSNGFSQKTKEALKDLIERLTYKSSLPIGSRLGCQMHKFYEFA